MKPILFNTEMVKAILDGRKTATRRLVKPIPPENARLELIGDRRCAMDLSIEIPGPDDHRIYTPPFLPGDILYVRETWQYGGPLDGNDQVIEPCQYYYAADGDPFDRWLNDDGSYHDGMKWHPSIHMPKEAARIFLRVTDVRVERLQEITAADCEKEGAARIYNPIIREDHETYAAYCRKEFSRVWNSTLKHMDHIRYGWSANPWVWVIEFERCEKPKENGKQGGGERYGGADG